VDHRCAQQTLALLLHLGSRLTQKGRAALKGLPSCSTTGRMPFRLPVCSCMVPITKPALNGGSVRPAVYFHNPWYTTWGGFKTDDCTRQALEPLLNMYGADLVYNGELHVILTASHEEAASDTVTVPNSRQA